MSRLIDADALIEDLKGSLFYSDAIPFVEEASTAYDVDKVVEEIKSLSGYEIYKNTFESIIEIVRKGGIENE